MKQFIVTSAEADTIRIALVSGLTNNAFNFAQERAAKLFLKEHFPDTIIKRACPTVYARDLKV
jgi:hypothetical protein